MAAPSSLLGVIPQDSIVDPLVNLISKFARLPHVEFEGKLGVLLVATQNQSINVSQRLSKGVLSPVAIDKKVTPCQFRSALPQSMFSRCKELLNNRVANGKGDVVCYSVKTTDKVYSCGGNQYRVTIDQNGVQKECITKKHLGNIDITSPQTPVDFRISVNQEQPVKCPADATVDSIRSKNRLSYKHGILSVDLTEVKTSDEVYQCRPKGPSTTTYEVEIEIYDMKVLLEEQAKGIHGNYYELCKSLWTNLYGLGVLLLPQVSIPPILRPAMLVKRKEPAPCTNTPARPTKASKQT